MQQASDTYTIPPIPEKFSPVDTYELVADFMAFMCHLGDQLGIDPDATTMKATRVHNNAKVNVSMDNLLNRADAYLEQNRPTSTEPVIINSNDTTTPSEQ